MKGFLKSVNFVSKAFHERIKETWRQSCAKLWILSLGFRLLIRGWKSYFWFPVSIRSNELTDCWDRVDTSGARETVLLLFILLLIEKELIGWLESTPPSHEDGWWTWEVFLSEFPWMVSSQSNGFASSSIELILPNIFEWEERGSFQPKCTPSPLLQLALPTDFIETSLDRKKITHLYQPSPSPTLSIPSPSLKTSSQSPFLFSPLSSISSLLLWLIKFLLQTQTQFFSNLFKSFQILLILVLILNLFSDSFKDSYSSWIIINPSRSSESSLDDFGWRD